MTKIQKMQVRPALAKKKKTLQKTFFTSVLTMINGKKQKEKS